MKPRGSSAVRAELPGRSDRFLLGTALLLTGIGLVVIFSTASPLEFDSQGPVDSSHLKRSIAYAALGLLAALGATRLGPQTLRRLAYPALFVSVALLCLVWIPPFGQAVNGAHRWVRIGGFGFQPSEIAKLGLVVFLAHSLAKREARVKSFSYGFLPSVVLPGLPIGLVLCEPDFGTAALMAVVVAAMAYVGGVRRRHLGAGLAFLVPVAGYLLWFVDFRRDRILAFLDPWGHAQGAGFQLVQSLLAFGIGGVWGVGLGAGRQKLYYLPEAHTDFILSVWAEEIGLVGVLVVLLLVSALVWRGFAIAFRRGDPFQRLLATGITTWVGLQAALNALVVTGCLPTKGLPFPFLSYGGSGLVVTLTAVGLLAGLTRGEQK
jgi:cell division protein FtsW